MPIDDGVGEMLRRTETGVAVFYPFRPLNIGLVFEDENLVMKAKSRYWIVILSLLYCVWAYLVFFNSQSNEPTWWYRAAYIGIALSVPTCFFIIFLVMPERVLYIPQKHGPIKQPNTDA